MLHCKPDPPEITVWSCHTSHLPLKTETWLLYTFWGTFDHLGGIPWDCPVFCVAAGVHWAAFGFLFAWGSRLLRPLSWCRSLQGRSSRRKPPKGDLPEEAPVQQSMWVLLIPQSVAEWQLDSQTPVNADRWQSSTHDYMPTLDRCQKAAFNPPVSSPKPHLPPCCWGKTDTHFTHWKQFGFGIDKKYSLDLPKSRQPLLGKLTTELYNLEAIKQSGKGQLPVYWCAALGQDFLLSSLKLRLLSYKQSINPSSRSQLLSAHHPQGDGDERHYSLVYGGTRILEGLRLYKRRIPSWLLISWWGDEEGSHGEVSDLHTGEKHFVDDAVCSFSSHGIHSEVFSQDIRGLH